MDKTLTDLIAPVSSDEKRGYGANAIAGLEAIGRHSQSERIGTLSFPVRDGAPIHNNTHRIEEIISRRCPALLLCAGWSVPSRIDLEAIKAATGEVKTVVVLEASKPRPRHYFRVCRGKIFDMEKQFFSQSKDATEANLCRLDKALPTRSFTFLRLQTILLVCGEVTLMRGRPPGRIDFRPDVPHNLRDCIRAPGTIILNPTHTRMKRWEPNEWRRYLSSEGHTCVSASNWDLSGQRLPSRTLHSLWRNGQNQNPVEKFENEFLCYREWALPKL